MFINTALKSFKIKPNSALSALSNKGSGAVQRPMSAAAFSSSSQNDKYAPWEESKILLTGCQGQIGVPLAKALVEELGKDNVIASDVAD